MPLDLTQPFEEVAPPRSFDATQPFEDVPVAQDWSTLFSGVENVHTYLLPDQKQAMDRVLANGGADEELAQGINQAYVRAALKDWPIERIQSDWPAVKVAFGKHALGIDKADWSDTILYQVISQQEDAKKGHLTAEFQAADPFGKMVILGKVLASHAWQDASKGWDAANKPFLPLPEAPQMPNMANLGQFNPAVVAGVYNAFRPLLEGIETPLGVATLPLGAVAKSSEIAKMALGGLSAVFSGLMAKSTLNAVQEAKANPLGPDATLQQQIEHYGKPVAAGGAALLAAFGAVHELKSPAQNKVMLDAIRGKTPGEAAVILRDEAVKTADENLVEPLTKAADELDAISEQGVKAQNEAQMELDLETKALVEETAALEAPKPKEEAKGAPAEQKPAEGKSEAVLGIKNADVDAELASMDMEPTTHGESITMRQMLDDATATAKRDPEAGRRLARELQDKPRPITAREDALLTHELNRIAVDRDAAEVALEKAGKSGDENAVSEAIDRVRDAQEAYRSVAEVSTRVGTENAQGLAMRRLMVKRDFSLAAMERAVSTAREGKPLSPEVQAEIKALHEKIATTQKALDDYIASRPKAEPARPPSTPRVRPQNRITAALSEQATAARERIKARALEGRQYSGLDPQELADHAIIGADYIAKGVSKFAQWSEAMVKEFGEKIRPSLRSIYAEASKKASQERRLGAAKTRMEKQAETLREKTAARDISPKPKPEPLHLDKEANRLQAELEIAKQEFEAMKKRETYERLTPFRKVTTHAADLYDGARALMTTGELSFLGRQGGFFAAGHPIKVARMLPDAFKALISNPKEAHAINLRVLNHPDIRSATQSKLTLLDEGATLTRQEEAFMGRLTNYLSPKNIPGIKRIPGVSSIPGPREFNQAAIVFLNQLRFEMFRSMKESSGGLDAAEQAQVAKFVNQATGRGGLGSLEGAAVPVARFLFAPRFLASRFQIATGHSMWGGTWRTRRLIAKEYARTLVGLSAFYAAAYSALEAGDDDVEISDDPTSSDFGKIRIGKTRLDPLGGVSQAIVFSARTADAAIRAGQRELADTDAGKKAIDNGIDWGRTFDRFRRSKMHPVPAAIENLFRGTDLGNEEATMVNQTTNMMMPLTWEDIYEALEEQDLPEGSALAILAVLGAGLQTYDANKSKTVPSTTYEK